MAQENKVVYGLKNVHYSKMTINETGKVVYAKPTAVKGAVEISLESKAELVSFEADNEVYYSAPGTSSYEGTLTSFSNPPAGFFRFLKASNNLFNTSFTSFCFALSLT